MDRIQTLKFVKGLLAFFGALSVAWAVFELSRDVLHWGFFIILALIAVAAPRMSLALPRSRLAISFSDAFVFLAFLLYGGPAAILTAAFGSLALCLYLRTKSYNIGVMSVVANVSINAISMAVTYALWLGMPHIFLLTPETGTTQHMIATLGCMALSQFVVSSSLSAVYLALREGSEIWQTWRRGCVSSSLTEIVGASLAGIVFKVATFGDPVTAFIAFVAIGIAYFSYRFSINELNDAIVQTEAAERERSDIERTRRQEAERHASELCVSLEKEELANAALRKSEKDLQHAALYDSLTDLPNRKHLGDMLKRLIDRYKEDNSEPFYILFLDIRKFKNINDSLGHTLGDKVLMVAAKRFARMVASTDMVARIGGDEFAIILRDLTSVAKAQKVARRIFDSISQPFTLSSHRIAVGVNIGIAPCSTEYDTPEDILRDADIAMHYAKERNSGVEVFTKEMRVRFLERIRYEDDLAHAIERNELSMNYQPLVDLGDGGLLGFEALLRWHHSEIGHIPPNKFIPIAEESGLIIPITKWILTTTCKQIAAWKKISPSYHDIIVSVNISGKHLSDSSLIDDVQNAVAEAKISPSSLKLEITESAAMENAEQTIGMLNKLKTLGVQISIDDFGTGYSSLSYLHRLPFDTLKIDRSFVTGVGADGENSEILQTIISLAKNLKKKVIAEGIETESQLTLLKNLGCDYGQGYLLARPQNVEKMESSLYEGRNWLPEKTSSNGSGSNHKTVEETVSVFSS